MNAALTYPPEPSPARERLCNRANAERVAARLFEATQAHVAVVRTTNPLQPFRVVPLADTSHDVIETQIVC